MKKTAALLIFMIISLTFTGCAKPKTAEEIYAAAVTKTEKLTARDIAVEASIKTTGFISLEAKLTADTLATTNGNLQVLSTVSSNLLGQKTDGNFYYKAGTLYGDLYGEKVKAAVPEADVKIALGLDMQAIKPEHMEELTMEKTESKSTVFSYKIKADGMDAIRHLPIFSTSVFSLPDNLDIGFSELKGTTTVNESGYAVGQTITGKINVTVLGKELSADIDIKRTENNIGDSVEISLPSDLDSYSSK